jgi:homoserine O-succinyltransferase
VLQEKEYHILTEGYDVGADLFIKPCCASLFLFLQGHPEYDGQALMREYRRDIIRFLWGQSCDYPALPVGYFDAQTECRLLRLRQRTLSARDVDLAMLEFDDIMGQVALAPEWKPSSVQLYRNWLCFLLSKRSITP